MCDPAASFFGRSAENILFSAMRSERDKGAGAKNVSAFFVPAIGERCE